MSGPGLHVPRGDPRFRALQRLRLPAFLLLCAALIDLLFCIVMAVLLSLGIELVPASSAQAAATAQRPELWQVVVTFLGVLLTRGLTVGGTLSALYLRRWHLALVGALAAITPLAPACCLGLFAGGGMVFVLLAPEVRQHFT